MRMQKFAPERNLNLCTPLNATTKLSPCVQVTERPKKTVEYKRKGYTMLEEDDEDDDVDLNVQMVPLQDNFLPETGIDCTLTQEAEEAGDVYAPYLPVSLFDVFYWRSRWSRVPEVLAMRCSTCP